jgi:hypothetical protein
MASAEEDTTKCKEFSGERIKKISAVIAAFTVIAGLMMAFGMYKVRGIYEKAKEQVMSTSSTIATFKF